MLRAMVFRSAWGWMGIAESAKGICAVILPQATKRAVESKLQESGGFSRMETRPSPSLRQARAQVLQYLEGTNRPFSLSLDIEQGTAFQRRVWRVLQRMPYGSLRSYQWVANHVGGRRYARAVGNAVGANPIPIVIPCHRVIAQNGSIGGFSSGLPMKRRLLELEGTLSRLQR